MEISGSEFSRLLCTSCVCVCVCVCSHACARSTVFCPIKQERPVKSLSSLIIISTYLFVRAFYAYSAYSFEYIQRAVL